jgi:hypothetical protein
MEEMPNVIYCGDKSFEYRKEKSIDWKWGKDRKRIEVPVWKYVGNDSREGRSALHAALVGYKFLWNEVKRNPEAFHELVEKLHKGDIEEDIITIGKKQNFTFVKPEYDIFDRYDFGEYTR